MSMSLLGATGVALLVPATRALSDGVLLGLLVALGAVGLALVVATARLVNFAHAALVAAGGYLAFFVNTTAGLHVVPAALIAIVGVALLGAALERGLWRPLRARGVDSMRLHLVVLAVAILLDNLLGFLYFFLVPGGVLRPFHAYAVQSPWHLGPVTVTPRDLVLAALTLMVLVGVAAFVSHTRLGKGIRAVGDDGGLAAVSGIDPDRVRLVVWILAGGLAALCGVFFGLSHGLGATNRISLLVLMFAAVLLGGTTTVAGPAVGGLAVGVVTQLSTLWVPHELMAVPAVVLVAVALWLRTHGSARVREALG